MSIDSQIRDSKKKKNYSVIFKINLKDFFILKIAELCTRQDFVFPPLSGFPFIKI